MSDKHLNFAVIGASEMATLHMKGVVENPNATLVAICDINEKKALEAAEKVGVDASIVCTDWKAVIARPDVDAVIIVTPDQLHREMACAALEAGKHVLCEKPLALKREDVDAIVAATKKTDKKFMVGQICRYTPGFKMAKEAVEAGEIGELMFVESEYAHDYTNVMTPDRQWRLDPLRNGVIGGGCHAVDLLRWIVGADPCEVKAYGMKKIFTHLPYDDTHIAIMQFPNGVAGKVFVSISCKRNYTMRSVFYGTKGTIICDNTSPEISVFHFDPSKGHSDEEKRAVVVNNHNASAEVEEFVDIVINDKPVATTVYEGAKTVAACQAIVKAAETGDTIVPDYNF